MFMIAELHEKVRLRLGTGSDFQHRAPGKSSARCDMYRLWEGKGDLHVFLFGHGDLAGISGATQG
jgi:hypothetical protein